jgi:hypothetical protein
MMKLTKTIVYILTLKLNWLNVFFCLSSLLLVNFNFLQHLFLFMGGDWDVRKYCCRAEYGWNCS